MYAFNIKFTADTESFAIQLMVITLFKKFRHCLNILVAAVLSMGNDTLFARAHLISGIGLTIKLDRTDSRSA